MRTIGIDTGGTFTDLVEIRSDGTVEVHKVPSTPDNFARGVLTALDRVDGPEDIISVTLGTTIATNAFLTRTGATVGLLTTAGHGDTLEVMRVFGRVAGFSSTEMQSYAATDKPVPVVPRNLVREIVERIDCRGEVIVPLDEEQAIAAIDSLVAAGVEVVAVSFLWSFLEPRHERRIREIAAARFPGFGVILSSDVVPKLGEYERTVATAVDAFVSPALTRYLDRIGEGRRERGLSAPILVMHSTGGVGTEAYTREHAITTLFSGPAGGVIGAQRLGEQLGHTNIVCTDMGGTSFDVGLVLDGRPLLRTTTTIDQHVMFLPSIDIVAIGSGGGSLLSAGDNRLRIGPKSAGADPGPACYGRGGTQPTITDVDVVLGYIDPARFIGGLIELDPDRARAALDEHVASPLGMTVDEAAAAAFTIANARMADLIRKVTVERGFDPRDFVLYAYGGLGPLHAPFYGIDFDVRAIVIPLGQISSVFSAYGIAVSDLLHVYETSRVLHAPFDPEALEHGFAALEEEAERQLEADGIPVTGREIRHLLEMRYKGQFSEIVVPVRAGPLAAGDMVEIVAAFERLYVAAFGPGSLWREGQIEIAAFRIEAIGRRRMPAAGLASRPDRAAGPAAWERDIYWPSEGRYIKSPVLSEGALSPDRMIEGPAALDLTTTTVLVPPGWNCRCYPTGTLILTLAGGGAEGAGA